VQSSKFVFVR